MPPDRPRRSTRQAAPPVKSEPIEDGSKEYPQPTPSFRSSPSLSPVPSPAPSPPSDQRQFPSPQRGEPTRHEAAAQRLRAHRSRYSRSSKGKAANARYRHSAAGKAARETRRMQLYISKEMKAARQQLEEVERSDPTPEHLSRAKAAVEKAQQHQSVFERQREERQEAVRVGGNPSQVARRKAEAEAIEEFLKRNEGA